MTLNPSFAAPERPISIWHANAGMMSEFGIGAERERAPRLANGSLWDPSPVSLERISLDGKVEKLPSPESGYNFIPRESLAILNGGRRLLVADNFTVWLLDLPPATP